MRDRRVIAIVVGWVAGLAVARLRGEDGLGTLFATAAASALVALALVALVRIWWPRR